MDALSACYRVIVPELWVHGRSGPLPAGAASIRDVARQYLGLLDALRVAQCALIGHSIGGMWGAELALMAPERVGALVLLDTPLAAEPATSHAAYMGLLALVEQSRAFPEPVISSAAPLFFAPAVDSRDPTLLPAFADRLRSWNPDRVVDSVVPLGRLIFDRRAALADLSTLTLVTTGSEDQARSMEEGRAMAERIGCPFIEIPAAGHTPSLEAPDFLNRLLIAFLGVHWREEPR